jgi:hypothetical protein
MLLFVFAAASTYLSNVTQDGYTALIHAAEEGHIECVRLLSPP